MPEGNSRLSGTSPTKKVTEFVRNNIPNAIKNRPLKINMGLIYLFTRLKWLRKVFMASDVIKNGMARPKEYTKSSLKP